MKQKKSSKSQIALVTGGGDAPGLNPAIRAAVIHAMSQFGAKVFGVAQGFTGLMESKPRVRELNLDDVFHLQFMGGTILGAASQGSPFKSPHSRDKALALIKKNCQKLKLNGLIVMGGDGTQVMAREIVTRLKLNVVGIPKTIDNDLPGCEQSLGFATAVEVISQAAKSILCTAHAHERLMILEVMGRTSGFLALHAALASGVDGVLIPELPFDINHLAQRLKNSLLKMRAKSSMRRGIVLIVAEGAKPKGNQHIQKKTPSGEMVLGGIGQWLAEALAERLGKSHPIEIRVTVLGHVQRGAEPQAPDRILGTELGVRAVDALFRGSSQCIIAPTKNGFVEMPYDKLPDRRRTLSSDDPMMEVARRLDLLWY